MIDAIAQIGKDEWERRGYKDCPEDLLKVFIEDPSGGGRYNKVMVIQLEEASGKIRFNQVVTREYDERDQARYLYRAGSSNGTDYSPTAKITEPKKTLPNKIIRRIEETLAVEGENDCQEEKEIIQGMLEALKGNQKRILSEMEKLYDSKSKDTLYFATISLIQNGKEKLPGDFLIFQKKLVDDSIESMYYGKTLNVNTRRENNACSICLESHKETYGLASPFTFYTLDKPGYIAGGFSKEQIAYNYPVCRQCAIFLEIGKKYLDQFLRFNAFGIDFFIIPAPLRQEHLPEILKQYKKLNNIEEFFKFQEAYMYREEKLLKALGEAYQEATINLVFFKEDNNSFRILMDIQDVLPSRLNSIFDALDSVNKAKFFRQFPIGSEKEIPIYINFTWLADLFIEKISLRYFLECFAGIIKEQKIDYGFLMNFISQDLYQSFAQQQNDEKTEDVKSFRLFTLISYGFLLFLNCLNILNFRNGGSVYKGMPQKNQYWAKDFANKREMMEAFFQDHSTFLDRADKKAVFLVGYLSQRLMNIQARDMDGNTPFRARLKGLKLSQRDIWRLYHEVITKLDEYKKNYYKDEEALCAEYLMEAGDSWEITAAEIPFYFSLGMNTLHCFITDKKDEEDGEQ